jgi:hypothetical protein
MNHVARIRSVMQLKVSDWRTNTRARGPINPESFEPEFSWQVEALTALARDQRRDRSLHCESGR